MMFMSVIVLPAIIALMIKVGVLTITMREHKKDLMFNLVIVAFAALNLAEITLLVRHIATSFASLYLIKSYYLLATVCLALVILYVVRATEQNYKWLVPMLATIVIGMSALIMFSSLVIADVKLYSYASTAVPGVMYWLWQLVALVLLIGVCLLSVLGYCKAKNHQVEIRSVYVGCALAPLILFSVIILGLMFMGFQVTAVVSTSIGSSLFVVIMLASEYQHKLTDVRRFIPWSNERRSSRKIMEIFSGYSRDELDYRDAVSEIERLLVLHKYDKNQGNASETAGKMGIPRSSLYSAFNRLNIKAKGETK